MLTTNLVLTAGQTVKFNDVGNFVRVLAAPANVTLRTFKSGQVVTEAAGVGAGFAEQYEENFDAVEFYSLTAQTIQIVIRLGSIVYYDQAPTGDVSILSQMPATATGNNSQATVTNVNAQLVPANVNRKYLLIQNNDAAGIIYVSFFNAATLLNGVKIAPGGSYELSGNMLNAAVNAIGSIASNANIVVVTG